MSTDPHQPASKPDSRNRKAAQKLSRAAVVPLNSFIERTFSFREGTDYEGASSSIKSDVVFRGHSIWILIFSILVASVGLNVNSTAVVIGAMLISPLMGPIIGVGFGVGTNDFPFVLRALKNLGTMTVVSLLTSTLFFIVSPMKEPSAEILARTQPTIMDVLIALFGGLAGIVAGSRQQKGTVISGVAIATALMPPLCSAGFGLANGAWSVFGGAFYLFLLNSVFICLGTVVVTRYLRFPTLKYLDPRRAKVMQTYLVVFVLLVTTPSAFAFYHVVKESKFKSKIERFIRTEFDYPTTSLIEYDLIQSDSVNTLNLYLLGDPITGEEQQRLRNRLARYQVADTRLIFHQGRELPNQNPFTDPSKVFELMEAREAKLQASELRITELEGALRQAKKDSIPLQVLEKEIRIHYEQVERVAYGKLIETDFERTDSVPTFLVRWSSRVPAAQQQRDQVRLAEWLAVRLSVDSVRVIKY